MRHERIKYIAHITKALKGNTFQGVLQDNPEHILDLTICGKMRIKKVSLEIGDLVDVELSPYNLHMGRITWRH